ncbi:MAG TPA: DUF4398 domain-containing protein, partial [Bryobacteraceae bacterium]|nr:DUF4398 domain-containing protein [Bryobacteraceae bacterium]
VISRTTPAVNYGHRNLPTKIDFRGTVLYPEARGEATVESRRGAADIDAKFSNLDSPARFGPTYLTYVLWALTPQGRPVNLGELVLNSANKGRLKVSSELQSFAMIVTAEPYFSVTQPSGVVVMENIVRPDTVGNIETVEAKYELLPRQHFTYETGSRDRVQDTPKVTMIEYESLLALYQAQNALQIAKSAGADQAAPDIMQRAEQLYQQAQTYHSQKSVHKQVVMTARQAAQTAEDARILALKRQAPQQSSLTQ